MKKLLSKKVDVDEFEIMRIKSVAKDELKLLQNKINKASNLSYTFVSTIGKSFQVVTPFKSLIKIFMTKRF